MNPIDILIKYWGHTHFRLAQEEVINEIIAKKDTLALLPTAGGKSICYQIPALLEEGLCLVISPLIALMHDQIRHLESKGIKSVYINSEMHYSEIETALTNCIYGGIKFLYLSPEKLQNQLVQLRIKEMNINLIAVDEAHCISEWGHNFRPFYRYISEIRNIIPQAPILALTATANANVIKDIQHNLLFKKENVIRTSFARENISYRVENVKDKKSKLLILLNKIRSSVIIYTNTRRKTREITEFLRKNNLSANYYHAGLTTDEKSKRQLSWIKNQTRIIVATNAFGMGINKEDVKLIIHMDLPSSIESYFQESGRAGRNGEKAYAYLIANNTDIKRQKDLLELTHPPIKEIIEGYQNIANYLQIAENEFPKDPIPFDLISFSNKYKTSTLKAYNIIKYLEKEQYLKLIDPRYSSSKIRFAISSTELYKFQITNRFYDPFIKLLLRSYENLFNNLTIINEKQIANKYNTNEEKIKKLLLQLKQLEIIEYQKSNNIEQITFLEARKDFSYYHIDQAKWKKRKNYSEKRMDQIINYMIIKDTCRSQLLLHYFNEKANECGICDICIIKKRKKINKKIFNIISERIEKLITDSEMDLSEISNSLIDIREEEIINILTLLFEDDKIMKFGNKYQWKK